MTVIASGCIIKGNGEGVHVITNNIANKEVTHQLQYMQQKHKKEIAALKREIEDRDRLLMSHYKANAAKIAEYTRPEKTGFITYLKQDIAFILGITWLFGTKLHKAIIKKWRKRNENKNQ